ncbi:unnamed protein product [Oreochromis niloticus]|nr:unnamed protein product [Mustela putorius furo]
MLKITLLCLSFGVFLWGFASCSITRPDAMCCADLLHCCPSGYRCNLVTMKCQKLDQPWLTIPMVKKEAAEKPNTPELSGTPLQELKESHVPDQIKKTMVYCDSYTYCPDGTTCCRHPKGGWFCCPYSPGKCCLDGYHCCPIGFDCDRTYTHCVREKLTYPFLRKPAVPSAPASLIPTSEEDDN